MPFSVRGQPLTKVNKLVTDFKVARENSKLRGYLSPFETNVWSHISPRFEGCCLRLAELCKNNPSDREMNEIEMIVADLQDLCSVGINLERFTLLMDEMQKAIYVYNLVESSTLDVLYIYESRGLERFQARVDLFKEILHQFEQQDEEKFSLVPFTLDNKPVDLDHVIHRLGDYDEMMALFINLAGNYDTMPDTPFSEKTFFAEF